MGLLARQTFYGVFDRRIDDRRRLVGRERLAPLAEDLLDVPLGKPVAAASLATFPSRSGRSSLALLVSSATYALAAPPPTPRALASARFPATGSTSARRAARARREHGTRTWSSVVLERNCEFVCQRRAEKSAEHLLGGENRSGVDRAEFPIRPDCRVERQAMSMQLRVLPTRLAMNKCSNEQIDLFPLVAALPASRVA